MTKMRHSLGRWLCPHVTSRIVASVWVRSLKSLELEFCEDLGSEEVDEILNEWLLFCPIAFFSPGVVGNE